jgi:hypothetical protein
MRPNLAIQLACLTTLLCLAPLAPAQETWPQPRLHGVFPLGAKAGSTIEFKLTKGLDLDDVSRLIFSHPGITAVPLLSKPDKFYPEARPVADTFTVTVAPEVPPGVYEVRAVGYYGMTNARRFAVGSLPEIMEGKDNDEPSKATPLSIGSVANGSTALQKYDYYKIAFKKGQRVIIEGQAERLDSKADLTLVLLDSTGRTVAESRDAVGKDPLVDFTPPADAEYVLKVYDFVYDGGPEYSYRVVVSAGPWIDFIDPPLAVPGSNAQYTIYGRNLAGSAPAPEIKTEGPPLEKLTVTIQAPPTPAAAAMPSDQLLLRPYVSALDFFIYQFRSDAGLSNPVRLIFASAPVVVEQEPNDDPAKAQHIAPPCEIVGRFNPSADRDWYTFEAKKDDHLWIEIDAQRLGLPTDPFILIQQMVKDEKGVVTAKDIVELDDPPQLVKDYKRWGIDSSDPGLEFVAPADGTYRILVHDLYNNTQGDPRFFYRLRVRPAQPDFRLVALPAKPPIPNETSEPWSTVVRRGGAERIQLLALRREGFNGAITVGLESLPPGISAAPAVIGEGANTGTLVVSAAADAAPFAGPVNLVGRAKIGDAEQTRVARTFEFAFPAFDNNFSAPARLTRSFAIAIDDHAPSPVSVRLGADQSFRMARGGKIEIPVKYTPSGEFKGALTLKALDLPLNVIRVADVALSAEKPDAVVTVDLDPSAPVGVRTFFMQSDTLFPFQRNPAAAERAKADQERITKLAADLAAAFTKSQQDRQQSDQAFTQATQVKQQAVDANAKAAQESTAAAQQAKQTADASAAMKKAFDEAAKKSADAAAALAAVTDPAAKPVAEQAAKQAADQAAQVKTVADAAAKQADDAAAAAKAAAEKVAKAEAALKEATDKAAAAEAAKKTATDAEAAAQAETKAAEAAKAAAAEIANKATAASAKKDIKIEVHSTLATLDIVPSAVTFTTNPPALTVAATQKVEFDIKLVREFGADGEVTFDVRRPDNSGGIGIVDKVKIEKGAVDGKLVLTADQNVKPGVYKVFLRGRINFNARDLQFEQPIELTVAPVPPPAEPKK